jgi:hypothetical protein
MLYLETSRIHDAGLGLFTDSLIKRGDIICRYEGDVMTYAQFLKRNTNFHEDLYVFYVNKRKCIDAYPYKDAMARYANDAAGKGRVPGIRNNARFEIIKGWPHMIASRNIHPGSEIYVAYGREYWTELAKLEKQRAETEAK